MKYGKLEKPVYRREDDRGIFEEIINFGNWQSLTMGTMKKGAEMGHHYHNHTIVYFFIIAGKALIKTLNIKTKEKKEFILSSNEGYIFLPEEVRIIHYAQETRFLLMKSHRYNHENPDIIEYKKPF